ncbi:MAG: tetratricopeptide repeat protein [bacterium]|nr:tetratricopeptide repeat protein [bacterium]
MARRSRTLACLVLLAGVVSPSEGRAQVAEVDVLAEARQLQDEATELYDGGRPAEALPLAERALEIRETVYGHGHPLTASTLNTMGLILQTLGDFEGARPYQERALAILERAMGPEHALTAVALHNLGALLRAMGDLSTSGSVSAVSQHLAKLRAYGLTTTRRDAQTIYYRLSDHEFLAKLRGSFFAEMETAFLSSKG